MTELAIVSCVVSMSLLISAALDAGTREEAALQALLWPVGYTFWRQQIHLLRHPGNQFPTLCTDRNEDPHQIRHWEIPTTWPSRIVSESPGWIWVRHGDAATSTLPRYRRKLLKRIDSDRFACNLRAIVRACEPSGVPSGNYQEHRSPHIKYVLQENANAQRSG